MRFVALKNNPFILTDIKFPWADTPGRHPSGQTPLRADTPQGRHPSGQTPPWADTPHLGRYPPGTSPPSHQTATAADGTHPTGIHSSYACVGIPKKIWAKLTSNQHSNSMIH